MDVEPVSNGFFEEAEALDGETDSDELEEARSERLPSLSLLVFDEAFDETVSTCLR